MTTQKEPKKVKEKKDEFAHLPKLSQQNIVEFLTDYGTKNKETRVLITTRLGNITLELYKETPLHRANFVFLVKQGYFNSTCFHRVVEDFIIQAGQSDKLTTVKFRRALGHYRLPPEFNSKLKHHKGALSAARRWNENPKKRSDAFEFFIVHKAKGLHHLDQEHTTFGKVIDGMDVVDKIAKEAIDKGEWPLINIDINAKTQ